MQYYVQWVDHMRGHVYIIRGHGPELVPTIHYLASEMAPVSDLLRGPDSDLMLQVDIDFQ